MTVTTEIEADLLQRVFHARMDASLRDIATRDIDRNILGAVIDTLTEIGLLEAADPVGHSTP